jgi:hypothetical protein
MVSVALALACLHEKSDFTLVVYIGTRNTPM